MSLRFLKSRMHFVLHLICHQNLLKLKESACKLSDPPAHLKAQLSNQTHVSYPCEKLGNAIASGLAKELA